MSGDNSAQEAADRAFSAKKPELCSSQKSNLVNFRLACPGPQA